MVGARMAVKVCSTRLPLLGPLMVTPVKGLQTAGWEV